MGRRQRLEDRKVNSNGGDGSEGRGGASGTWQQGPQCDVAGCPVPSPAQRTAAGRARGRWARAPATAWCPRAAGAPRRWGQRPGVRAGPHVAHRPSHAPAHASRRCAEPRHTQVPTCSTKASMSSQCGAKPCVPGGVRYELQPTGHCGAAGRGGGTQVMGGRGRSRTARGAARAAAPAQRITVPLAPPVAEPLWLSPLAHLQVRLEARDEAPQAVAEALRVQHAHGAALAKAAPHHLGVSGLGGCAEGRTEERAGGWVGGGAVEPSRASPLCRCCRRLHQLNLPPRPVQCCAVPCCAARHEGAARYPHARTRLARRLGVAVEVQVGAAAPAHREAGHIDIVLPGRGGRRGTTTAVRERPTRRRE